MPESLHHHYHLGLPQLFSFAVNASPRLMLPPGLFLFHCQNKWLEKKSYDDINNIDIKNNPCNTLILFCGLQNTKWQTWHTFQADTPIGCIAHLLPPGAPQGASASHLPPELKGGLCKRQVLLGLRKPPKPKGLSLSKAEVWVR